MGVMGRRHQVDVEGALILQLEHDLNQALRSDLDTEAAGRDLVVLAVDALERAAAKEDGAEPASPEMGGSSHMCSAARAILSVESAPQTPRAPFARAARQHRGQSSQASRASGVNSVCIVDPHFNELFGLFLGAVAPRINYSCVRRVRASAARPGGWLQNGAPTRMRARRLRLAMELYSSRAVERIARGDAPATDYLPSCMTADLILNRTITRLTPKMI